ncbi:MAG TPA: hypothetical protein PLO89_02010 [Spirochaetota bacterium]|nr:hypothetical protein [Spirochaetota bacterium]
MEKSVLVILLSNRREVAVKVQQILTDCGCIIKTRLGIHDGVQDKCSEVGLVMLELVGSEKEINELNDKLSGLSGVSAKLVKLSL